MIFLCYNSHSMFHSLHSFVFFFFLYSPPSFFILILCLILLIFFSSMCHSRCYLGLVGQPPIPSSSSFLEVMMSKFFWGFLFYYDKLFVALHDMVLGGSLWIYQEDVKGFLGHYVYHSGFIRVIRRASSDNIHTLVGCI